MNRREFIRQGASVPLAAGLAGHAEASAPKKKPNVLYVFSDEHRNCSLPGEPYNGALAPHLAQFAKENLSFRQCISNYPVCSPYRGILMSGKWPHQSGIIDNAIDLAPDCGSIGKAFHEAGYETSYIGKWHLSHKDAIFIPKGPARQDFVDWHVWANTNPHWDKSFTFDPNSGERIQPKGYNCTLMTNMALDFINSRKPQDEKPWMMMLSWNPPHPPFQDAPQNDKDLYDPKALPLRPNIKLNAQHSDTLISEEKLREAQRDYYAHITAVDLEFKRLLLALEQTGQAENTIVVYTSDHGEMMGSHGYMGKRLPWEESCNVPFIVRYPGVTPRGRSTNVLLAAVDIFPSICGLAGVEVPTHCVGRDLSAAMRGKPLKEPESVFLMHISKDRASGGDRNPAPLFRGIRTKRHTYAVADDGRWCFYDNREDPYQQHNLVADAKARSTMHDLDGEVLTYLKAASDPYPYTSRLKSISIHHTE